jgi:hypothetical protein
LTPHDRNAWPGLEVTTIRANDSTDQC